MGMSLYEIRDKKGEQGYSTWVDAQPNLHTFLTALNQTNPIIGCQFELVWSRWPRTIFFAKNITIPGVTVNTLDINHAGFTIKIPTHVTYENTEVSINIIADKEGFHYYDLRNMVMQTGHPLVAGDPRATIGNQFGLRSDEDIIEVRLRNRPADETHHHWVLHNFHPTGIGDIELSTDGGSFVEFELKGTITHITYDCGKAQQEAPSSLESDSEQPEGEADQPDTDDEDTDNDEFEGEPPFDDPTKEDEEDEEDDDEEYVEGDDQFDPENPPDWLKKGGTAVAASSELTQNPDGSQQLTETMSEVELHGETSVEGMELAQQCSDEMSNANQELKQALAEIANMPADENFTPETPNVQDDTFSDTKLPKPDQEMITDEQEMQNIENGNGKRYTGDRVTNMVNAEVTLKSQAQKDAYNAAIQKHKSQIQNTVQNYADAKAHLEAG